MPRIERTRRVAELIKRELSELVSRKLHDRRINSVTITDIRMSKDLKQSTVYVYTLDKEISSSQKEKLLNHAAKYLRRLLSQQINLRVTPNIIFKYDTRISSSNRMINLIDSLNQSRFSD